MSVEREDVRRALVALVGTRRPVRVRRRRGWDGHDGYVVALGDEWFLLARLSDDVALDGWTALRVRDVRSVERLRRPRFVRDALRWRGQWPPAAPSAAVDLDSTRGLLRSLRGHPLVTVHPEVADGSVCFVGALERVGERRVRLREVDPGARWEPSCTPYPLRHLTRVDVGDAYAAVLHAVAGPPPS